MFKTIANYLTGFLLLMIANCADARQVPAHMQYSVSMENAANHYYHVELQCTDKAPSLDFKMCVWTPGYYQILNFAGAVENFSASANGRSLKWEKTQNSTWRVYSKNAALIHISYDVKAVVNFVGNVYLNEDRGYITPGGLFMYLDRELRHPVTVQMKPYSKWPDMVATGLDTIPGKYHVFKAADFDVLYDSPFLMGRLEVLPQFMVKAIPHNFVAYKLPPFDRQAFMDDLQKIIRAGSNIIGDIPYTHYTFLSIGQGGGGIEHLNSASLSFSGGEGFNTPDARKKLYSFIAHEYFHNYNVKRIRPVELGPFDYSKENHTDMLWVSEGFTVYYEYMIVRHAGLMDNDDVLNSFAANIQNYENKPGRLYQSATQASWDTWSDGPFGRTGDEENKTISYYDKGPVLGLMLDFAIRHATNNRNTLDDVMRLLYNKYYKHLKRGFTEQEFREECEKLAGISLAEVFDYASTVKPVNYPQYFAYAGLNIDTVSRPQPVAWLGISAGQRADSLVISSVDYDSPAWKLGVRGRTKILAIDGRPASAGAFNLSIQQKKPGDTVKLLLQKGKDKQEITVMLGRKWEKSFRITPMPQPDVLQAAIYKSWMGD